MLPGGAEVMKDRCCHHDRNEARRTLIRTSIGTTIKKTTKTKQSFAAALVPGGAFLLLPKCPACLAGYIALGTGIGVSVATAAYLREGLVMLFVGIIGYFAVSGGRALTKHFRT